MSDKLAAGVRSASAVAHQWSEEDAVSEARKRIALEAELGTMTVRLQAARDALLQSETRMMALEIEKQTVEARLRLAQEECTRLEAQLVSAQTMRATADELIQHIRSGSDNVHQAITARSNMDAPTFELSFVRDSAGRIKSPVTAKPRA